MWRLIYSIPLWILFILLVFLPLLLISYILVPLAAACKAYRSEVVPHWHEGTRVIYHFTWPIMFVFDNWEDGIANDTYVKYDSMFMRIVYWSCFRNPVNNLRIVPYLSCTIEPDQVRFIGSFTSFYGKIAEIINMVDINSPWDIRTKQYDTKVPQWFFCWQGLYSNFYWQFTLPCINADWYPVTFGRMHLFNIPTRVYIVRRLYRFWIGWKIFPTDIYGVTEYRKQGAGFALQYKVVK